jgi:hypothetical protein
MGLVFLRGLRASGAEYAGGDILDPDTGQIYQARIRLSADGRQLVVRGFVGAPLCGLSLKAKYFDETAPKTPDTIAISLRRIAMSPNGNGLRSASIRLEPTTKAMGVM